ncbi:MAG: choice-of-anchor J domain-containing protein [Owenweeksia sp.]
MRRYLLCWLACTLCFFANTAYSQVLINEDFSSATGTTPPVGWTNNDLSSSSIVWNFDNNGSRTLSAPISSPAAIFDSDEDGFSGSSEDATLESPAFDASAGNIILSFDHYFFQSFTNATITVEVSNGTVWDTVLLYTSSTSDPQKELIDITAEAGASTNAKVRFHWTGTWDYYWILDNVKVEAVNCLMPSALGATNIASTSADLYWTTGGAANWNIEYGTSGFTPGSGTMINSMNDTVNISSLSPNTTYDFYVRDSCGMGDVSAWVGPYSFATQCSGITTLPYNETFNSTSATTGCWSVIDANTDGDSWSINTSSSYVQEGDQSYRVYTDFNGGSNDDYLVSPAITLTGNEQLKYWYRARSSSEPNDYEILISTTGNTPADFTTQLLRDTATSTTYAERTIDLSAYSGVVYLSFHIPQGGLDGYYLYVDNLTIEAIPSCPDPSALGATNIASTSATLFWDGMAASSWNVEYGPSGYTQGTGTAFVASNDTTLINGLSAQTSYDFYVQADCGGTTSAFVGPFTFTTACAPLLPPQMEDFVSGFPPACWNEADAGTPANGPSGLGSSSWTEDGFANSGSTEAVKINMFSNVTQDWILTPYYDLATGGPYQAEFDFGVFTWNTSTPANLGSDDEVQILVTNDNGASWTALATYDNTFVTASGGSHIIVDLSAYSGDTIQIGIWANEGSVDDSEDNDIMVDNFEVLATPACPDPFALGATAITSSSADLFWTQIGTGVSWTAEFGPVGFAQGTGTSQAAANDTVNISGLSPQTTYDFYVQADCGAGGTSVWVGPFTFTTACASLNSFPWVEDFEVSQGSIPACWENETGDDEDWIFRSGSIGHGATIDHTLGTSSGYYAGVDDSQGNANDTLNNLLTPLFDLTSLTVPELSFWYFIGNDASLTSRIVIDVYDGTTWNMDVATIVYNQTAWVRAFVDLTTYKSANTRIRFRGIETTDFNSDISIDDVMIQEAPACPDPFALSATAISATSASVYWSQTGGVSAWNIEYGPTGFSQGTGTVMAVTNDTVGVGSLIPQSDYDVYVQADCGGNGMSAWIGPLTFTTACAPLLPPQLEDFANGFLPTVCWDEADAGTPATGPSSIGSGSWTEDGFANSGSTGAVKTNMFTNSKQDWILTPSYDLATGGPYQAEFDFGVFTWNTSTPATLGSDDEVQVLVSNDKGATWTTLATYDNTFVTASGGSHVIIDLSAYSGDTVQMGIWANEGSVDDSQDNDIMLDNFEVRATPACPDPFGIAATAITASSASVYWSQTGGIAAWNVEYGPVGFSQGTGTVLAATNDTVGIGSLSPQSSYDVYVQADCGSNGVSVWVGPFTFTTACAPLLPPQLEDFTTGFLPTVCWDEADGGTPATGPNSFGAGSWEEDGFANSGSTGAVKINMFTNNKQDWILTPSYDLASGGPYQAEFDFGVFTWNTATPATLGSDDEVQVLVSNDKGATWTALATYDNTFVTATGGSHVIIDLTAYSGDTVQMGIWANEGSVDDAPDNDIMLDNFEVRVIPACPDPFTLGATNIGTSSASFYWSQTGSVNGWNIEYGPVGFGQGTGTVMAVTNDTVPVSGFMSNTTYQFYVQSDCGAGVTSGWVGPFTFTTACGPFLPPQLEDFSAGFLPGVCWDEADAGTPATGPSSFGSSSWTEDGFANNGSTGAVKINMFTNNKQDWILTPSYDLASGGPYQAEFDFGIFTWNNSTPATLGSDDEVQVLMSTDDGITWNNLSTFNNTYVTATGGNHEIFDLTAYSGDTVRFAIWANEGTVDDSEDNDIMIDNFQVRAIPACKEPIALGATNIGVVTADLFWTENGTATSWNLEYDVSGYPQGSAANNFVASNDTFSISNLTANTTYDFYVQADCGGVNGVSAWSGPFTFTTSCAPLLPPQLEDFVAGFLPSACWDEADAGTPATGPSSFGSSSWTEDGFANNGATEAVKINLFSNNKSDWILTPSYDLAAGGPYQVEYDFGVFTWNSATPANLGSDDEVQVLISNNNGTTWTALATYTSTYLSATGGDHVIIDLSTYSGDTVRFGIWASEGTVDDSEDNDIMLDNFEVRATPACPEPFALGAYNITPTSADVFWTEFNNATSWTVEYGTPGFTPGMGNGITVAATNDTVTLSPLNPVTSYDFYVQADCGASGTSLWSGPYTFTSGCAPINSFPWTEDFEVSQTVIPACWENETNDDEDWIFRSGTIGHGATTDHTLGTAAGHYAGIDDSQANTNDTINNLLTPEFDLTGLIGPELSFWHFIGNDNVLTSRIFIDVYDGANWNMAVDTIVYTQAAWLKDSLDLTPYISGSTRIRFRGIETTDFNSDISIDDVMIEDVLAGCPVAGADSTGIIVCDSLSSIDMNTYLGSTASAGGTWVDPISSGALTGNIFDATQVTSAVTYTFYYVVTAPGCPTDSAMFEVFVDTCSIGIEEFRVLDMAVYPNPTSGIVYIENTGAGTQDITVEVYSLNGQLLRKERFQGSERAEVDLGNYAKGLYNLKITSDNGTVTHRMIRE